MSGWLNEWTIALGLLVWVAGVIAWNVWRNRDDFR